LLYFIGQVLPYIAGGIFLVGVAYRVMGWLRVPVPFQLTLFPAPKDGAGQVATVAAELVFFRSLYHGDKSLWLGSWLMHASLALVLGGHVLGIYYLMNQFTLVGLSPEVSQQLSKVFGTSAGIVLMATIVYLLYRRTAIAEVKRLSDPADFFDLLLLLSVVITGNHMRLTTIHVDLPAIKAYLGGLLTFHPVPIPENWVFISHFVLVNLLLIYFPFSKLIHVAGFFVNRAMLVGAPPKYPTPPGTRLRSPFAAPGQSFGSAVALPPGTQRGVQG